MSLRLSTSTAWAIATFLFFLAWAFGPLFLGDVIFERDVYHLWHGQMEGIVRAIGEGHLPVWDPFVSFGEPLMELPAQILYPFTWFGALMLAGTYYSFAVLAHYAFGGLGMLLLLRALGASTGGTWIGIALWMSAGPWLSTANMLNLFMGTSWMPWILLAAERAAERRRVEDAVLWGGGVALCLLTCSEPVFLGGLLAGAWYVFRVFERGRPDARALGLALLALAVALALSAGQWLPLVAALADSPRAALDRYFRTYWSMHPLHLVQLVVPVFDADAPFIPTTILDDFAYPLLYSVFIGPVAAVLALVAVVAGRGRERFLGVAWAATAAFALGRHTPVYDFLAERIPLLMGLRFPVKAMLVGALLAAILAALGWDVVSRQPRLARGALVGLLLGHVLFWSAGRWIWGTLLADGTERSYWTASGLLPLVVVLVAALGAVSSLPARPATIALAALCLAPPLYYNHGLNHFAPASLLSYTPPLVRAFRQDSGRRLYFRERDADTKPVIHLNRPSPPGLSPAEAKAASAKQSLSPTVSRIYSIRGSFEDDVKSVHTSHLRTLHQSLKDAHGTGGELRLLRAAGVTHMATLDTRGTVGLDLAADHPTLMGDHAYLYRVSGALPLCYVVDGVLDLDGPDALRDLTYGSFDLRTTAIVPGLPNRTSAGGRAGTCLFDEVATDRLRASVESASGGVVVFVEAWAPGWTASIDGSEAEVHRANVAFRGVAIPPGRHVVELRYRPKALFRGLGISGASAVLLAVWLAARAGARSAGH